MCSVIVWCSLNIMLLLFLKKPRTLSEEHPLIFEKQIIISYVQTEFHTIYWAIFQFLNVIFNFNLTLQGICFFLFCVIPNQTHILHKIIPYILQLTKETLYSPRAREILVEPDIFLDIYWSFFSVYSNLSMLYYVSPTTKYVLL